MANKYLENETNSFEKLIELYENSPKISKIVILRTKEGLTTCKLKKDIVYISTDKSDDEILSIISRAKKVVFEEPVKEDIEEGELDPEILDLLEYYASEPKPKREVKKTASKKKQRFTFKKVKISINELLDKLEVLKEKDPEKFEKISSDLKEKIKTAIEKGKKYIAIGLVVLTVIGAAIGIGLNKDKSDKEQTDNLTQIEETVPLNTGETTFSIPTEQQEVIQKNEIDTVDEVKEDFIKDYLEAYNEVYGTEYTEAELLVTNLRGTSLYVLPDGRKVTRGSLPYETEKVLERLGGYEAISMDNAVLQVLLPSGKLLGTYDITTGEFIYSGNQLEDLENEDFEAPELAELGISYRKVGATGRLIVGTAVEDGISTRMRIAEYNEIDEEEERG